jgi:hypothetical protein
VKSGESGFLRMPRRNSLYTPPPPPPPRGLLGYTRRLRFFFFLLCANSFALELPDWAAGYEWKNFRLSVESGYIYIAGTNPLVLDIHLVPLTLKGGYAFHLGKFGVLPSLGAGMVFVSDTVRSITDFRFEAALNYGVKYTSMGEITGSGDTGTLPQLPESRRPLPPWPTNARHGRCTPQVSFSGCSGYARFNRGQFCFNLLGGIPFSHKFQNHVLAFFKTFFKTNR